MKRILSLMLVLVAVIAMTVSGTSALFSDTETGEVTICAWVDGCDPCDSCIEGHCGEHTVEFIEHDGLEWTYLVTSGSSPSLSHWVMEWGCCDNISAIYENGEQINEGEGWECGCFSQTGQPNLCGIKFDNEYEDGETRTVKIVLEDDPECTYTEACIDIGTKAANEVEYCIVCGPVCDCEGSGCEHYCADSVVEGSFQQGNQKNGQPVASGRSDLEEALGAPDGGCNPAEGFVSLGFGGELILEFCQYIGGSITVTEITCGNPDYPLEKIEVWGSINGTDWVFLGYADNTNNPGGSGRHETEIELDDNCCIKYVKLVDITDPADFNGYPNADGFDVDAVCGNACTVDNGSMVVVSDTDTMVTEAGGSAVDPHQNAKLAWVHTNWSNIDYDFGDGPADAKWIWETYRTDDEPAGSSAPVDGRVVRFQRDFCIPCNPTSATLHITADNGYEVWINGNKVGDAQVSPCPGWEISDLTEPHLKTSGWASVEGYSVDISWLDKGSNSITILAGNEQMDGGNRNRNPAGLIYELNIEYDGDCDYCCMEEPCDHYCADSLVESGFNQGLKKSGEQVDVENSDPEEALFEPDGDYLSLGFGGELVLEFCQPVGGPLVIIEITDGEEPLLLEKAEVWVSIDGEDWVMVEDNADNQNDPESSAHSTEIALPDSCCVRYVKIVDVTDPEIHGDDSDGFDIDSICGQLCEASCTDGNGGCEYCCEDCNDGDGGGEGGA